MLMGRGPIVWFRGESNVFKLQWKPFAAGCLTGAGVALFLVLWLTNGIWTAASVAGATAIIVLAYLDRVGKRQAANGCKSPDCKEGVVAEGLCMEHFKAKMAKNVDQFRFGWSACYCRSGGPPNCQCPTAPFALEAGGDAK